MKLSRQIKPISNLKAHAAEVIRNLGEKREPLVIRRMGKLRLSYRTSKAKNKLRKQWLS